MTTDPKEVEIEPCACGRCSNFWLTGIGTFVQGSGFTQDEAQRIADALNTRPSLSLEAGDLELADELLNQHRGSCGCPDCQEKRNGIDRILSALRSQSQGADNRARIDAMLEDAADRRFERDVDRPPPPVTASRGGEQREPGLGYKPSAECLAHLDRLEQAQREGAAYAAAHPKQFIVGSTAPSALPEEVRERAIHLVMEVGGDSAGRWNVAEKVVDALSALLSTPPSPDLEELRTLSERATAGPWFHNQGGVKSRNGKHEYDWIGDERGRFHGKIIIGRDAIYGGSPDYAFIVAAVNWVRSMLEREHA